MADITAGRIGAALTRAPIGKLKKPGSDASGRFAVLGSEKSTDIAANCGAALVRSQMRIDASLIKVRKLAACLSCRVAVRRHRLRTVRSSFARDTDTG
jgi:hypothetical protein